MLFSEKVRFLRKNHPSKLSQTMLASALGVSQRTVSHWELGELEPSLKDMENLCLFFGVSADYLLVLPKGMPYPDRD